MTTRSTSRRLPVLAGLAACAALAGCISFGAKPPPSLLTLTAAAAPVAGQEQSTTSGHAITVDVPSAPQALATTRVPVQISPTALAYVTKAQWVAPPTRLFAQLLGDTIAARTGRVVLSNVQAVGDPTARLGGELRRFGMDATTHEAVVSFEASLIRDRPGTGAPATVDRRLFEARVPVSAIDADTVGPALNTAANQVATQVADWVGR